LRKAGNIFAEPVSFGVRCGRTRHRITLTERGALFLNDHPVISLAEVFTELGGRPARCLEILKQWRAGDHRALPQPLRMARLERLAVKIERQRGREVNDPLSKHGIAQIRQRAPWKCHDTFLIIKLAIKRQRPSKLLLDND